MSQDANHSPEIPAPRETKRPVPSLAGGLILILLGVLFLLSEMDRIKEYSWCSGACGGVTDSNPEFAEWTANERIEEALCTGAEAIVTADPWSEKLFNDTMAKNGGGLKVYDVVELVAQAI